MIIKKTVKRKEIEQIHTIKKTINIDDIRSIEQTFDNKGNISNNKILMYCNEPIGTIEVYKNFDYMSRLIDKPNIKIKGFKK